MSGRWISQARDGWRIAGLCLLALQLILVSAVSVSATPVQRDIFGNPLCITDSGRDGSGDRHQLPECCVGVCAVASAFPLLGDAERNFGLFEPQSLELSAGRVFQAIPSPHIGSHGSQPRAPPVTV